MNSSPDFRVWGAAGGLMLTLFPAFLVAVGLASPGGSGIDLWWSLAVIGGPLVLLSAASAAGSLMLARRAEGRGPLDRR